MPGNLRYFYIISLILVLLAATGTGIFIHRLVSNGLEQVVKGSNISLAQSFINSVWNQHHAPGSQNLTATEMADFRTETSAFIEKLSIFRITIYDNERRALFTSRSGTINGPDGSSLFLPQYEQASQGNIVHRFIEEAVAEQNNAAQHASLVQTVYPIINPAYNPTAAACTTQVSAGLIDPRQIKRICTPILGMIEIFVDVTPQWNQTKQLQYVSTGSIMAIFFLVICMLYFTSKHSEAIIAKQHEINLELTAAAATAEAENRDKAQFLANISHELRTPLNAIIGFSEIIKKEAMESLHPTHQEYIRDINNSGNHLLSLINDILDYSKAEAGKLELDLAEVDISKILKNSMRLVIPRAETAQVTLVEDLPSDHIVAVTDAKKLKQVLLNLLSNAVKFTPPGGQVKVSAWQQVVDDMVCIEVRDTGIGIAPKDISKVMSPFGQVDSKLSRKYEGTGLGLPLSKKFVEIMRGEFMIESEVNVGTTITIRLPKLTANT